MRNGTYGVSNTSQYFYFPDDHPTMPGWFKGMENIIREWGMWPENGLNAQCEGFKCVPGRLLLSASVILAVRLHCSKLKNTLHHAATFATSIRNFTVN